MLGEPTVVEQRYLAVREVLDSGASVSSVATRYGVDRRTLHRWLIRYANEGLSVLADRSCKPDRCPHQIKPAVEALIVSMRRAPPVLFGGFWGVTIATWMRHCGSDL
jgi:transposase-like protein